MMMQHDEIRLDRPRVRVESLRDFLAERASNHTWMALCWLGMGIAVLVVTAPGF